MKTLHRIIPYLKSRLPPFDVITTCADLELFRPKDGPASASGSSRPFTLGYVGSVGVWYLFDETLRCFQLLRERVPDARLLVFNRGEHGYIRERMAALNVSSEAVDIETAEYANVPSAMQQMDAGVFFIKPLYSKIASAPT